MRSKSSFANSKDAAELHSAGQSRAAVPTCYLIAVAAFLLILSTAPLFAEVPRGPIMGGGIMGPPVNQRPPGLEFVGIEQHLNAEVPVDLEFRDELGNPVKLADYSVTDAPSF